MGKFFWYIIVPLIVIGSLAITIYSFYKPLDKIIKKEKLRFFIKIFSRCFTILLLIGYILSIGEGFENLNLGELSFKTYISNFFRTLEYFFGWVLVYWFVLYVIISVIVSFVWLILFKKLKR